MTTVRLVRVHGAQEEVLEGFGLTTRGEAFDCPGDVAARLRDDARFKIAGATKPVRTGGEA